jgi:hypothetical protein
MIIKKAPVWKSTNFDAGLYDITTFGRVWIISMYHQLADIWFLPYDITICPNP